MFSAKLKIKKLKKKFKNRNRLKNMFPKSSPKQHPKIRLLKLIFGRHFGYLFLINVFALKDQKINCSDFIIEEKIK